MLCHQVLSLKPLLPVVPETTAKKWNVSFVSGATKSQLALTPGTGSRLHLGAVTSFFRRFPGVQSGLRAPTRSPVEPRDPAQRRQGQATRSPREQQPWAKGRRAIPAESLV